MEESEEKHTSNPRLKSKLVKLQAVLGQAYGEIQLSNLTRFCEQMKDYERIACLNQKGYDSHHWLLALPCDSSRRMSNFDMKQSIRYRLGLGPFESIAPSTCLCGKKDIFALDPYHSLSCSTLRYHGTNQRHDMLVRNLATWIRRAGAIVQTEVGGLHSKDRKRPDIVYWFEGKTHVIDVTVTDPFNFTNTNRINNSAALERHVSLSKKNSSLHFDPRAARYEHLHSIVEKRKNKHYKELIEHMRKGDSDSAVQFHTAGAFTTGGLSPEIRD
jgi:hypothetical protein